MQLRLRRPQLSDKAAILEMLADFQEAGSPTDGFFGGSDFVYEDWLENIQAAEMGLALPRGFVPYIQYVSFDETGQALGFLNLRLMLNDRLLACGGHIGYSIRPSVRGRGYAKEQLRQGLIEARSKNIRRVLMTCDSSNEASRRTILANGASLEDKYGETECYWLDLEAL